MCTVWEYFNWVLCACNIAILIIAKRWRTQFFKLETRQRELWIQQKGLWHRRLDEADKLRVEARALRDRWKVANMQAGSQQTLDED